MYKCPKVLLIDFDSNMKTSPPLKGAPPQKTVAKEYGGRHAVVKCEAIGYFHPRPTESHVLIKRVKM